MCVCCFGSVSCDNGDNDGGFMKSDSSVVGVVVVVLVEGVVVLVFVMAVVMVMVMFWC